MWLESRDDQSRDDGITMRRSKVIKHGLNLYENTEVLQINIDFKPLKVTTKVTSDQRGTKRKSVTMDKNGNASVTV